METTRKDIEYDLRTIGLDPGSFGVSLLRKLYYGSVKVENLTDLQLEAIRETWNTRSFIPLEMWKCTECPKKKTSECEVCKKEKGFDNLYLIKPEHIEGESESDYNRRYVLAMVELLKTI